MSVVVEMCRRTLVKTLRRPVLLSFSFVQPLFWLLLFGFLFERVRTTHLGELRYLDYFAPGVGAMTVLFGASQSGIGWVRDLQTGFLQRMLRTPTSPSAILLGKLLADVARLVAQAIVVWLLAALLGARLQITWAYLPWGLLCLALFGFALSCVSSTIALATGVQEAMAAYVHVVNMPLLFSSTVLLPRDDMPAWLAAIARWSPLSLAVDAWRGALVLGTMPRPFETLGVLGGAALALFVVARSAMLSASARRP